MSSILNSNEFDLTGVFIWFGMDKKGRIAIMLNNGIGNIPIVLRNPNMIEHNKKTSQTKSVASDYIDHTPNSTHLGNNEFLTPRVNTLLDDEEKRAILFLFEEDPDGESHALKPLFDEAITLDMLLKEERSFLLSLLDKINAQDPLEALLDRYQNLFSKPRLTYNREKYSLPRLEYNPLIKDESEQLGALLLEYEKTFFTQLKEVEGLDEGTERELALLQLEMLKTILDSLLDEYQIHYSKSLSEITLPKSASSDDTIGIEALAELIENEVQEICTTDLERSDNELEEKSSTEDPDSEAKKTVQTTLDNEDNVLTDTENSHLIQNQFVKKEDENVEEERAEVVMAEVVVIEEIEITENSLYQNDNELLFDSEEMGRLDDLSSHHNEHEIMAINESNLINNGKTYDDGYLHASYSSSDHTNLTRIQGVTREKGSESLAKDFANLALQRGFYIYQAMYGDQEKVDFHNPVEHIEIFIEDKTKLGDYYRYLKPDLSCTIDAIPDELKHLVVVSDMLDFSKDRLLSEDRIDEFFTRLYQGY